MKRLEAFIQSDKQADVIDAITKAGVGGVTIIQSLGRGAGERPRIGGEQGSEISYNSIDIILTIVEDSQAEEIMNIISNAAYSGQKGDGKIFISHVEDGMDINTKLRGTKSL